MCFRPRDIDCQGVQIEANCIAPESRRLNKQGATSAEWVENRLAPLGVVIEKTANDGWVELGWVPEEVMGQSVKRAIR